MRSTDQLFRRNFVIAAALHGVLIAGVVLFEGWSMHRTAQPAETVEIVLPDYLGDMPKGPGFGKGVYTPAPPAGGTEGAGGAPESALPAEGVMTPEERIAPPAPPAPVRSEPGEILVPKRGKDAAKTKKAPPAAETVKSGSSKSPATPTKPAVPAKPTTVTAKSTGTGGSGTGTGTGKGPGPSAKDIRNAFASALKAGTGGTGYGDNRAPGGGDGSSSVIGSKYGSENGDASGRGAGTAFAWYYQHVHDRMYDAWQQPGRAVNYDKRLVSTIRLRVARDGTILEAKLVGGSGNRFMDDSAVQAARSVPRLEPLPDGLGTMTADITVNFRLKEG